MVTSMARIFVVYFLCNLVIGCSSSSPRPVASQADQGGRDCDHSGVLLAMDDLSERLAHLVDEEDIFEHDGGHTDRHSEHHEEEGSGAELEALKLLQELRTRLKILERKIQPGPRGTPDPELIKRHVIQEAFHALDNDPSVEDGYFTSAQQAEARPSTEEEGLWEVDIKFKRSRRERKVELARFYCHVLADAIECEMRGKPHPV